MPAADTVPKKSPSGPSRDRRGCCWKPQHPIQTQALLQRFPQNSTEIHLPPTKKKKKIHAKKGKKCLNIYIYTHTHTIYIIDIHTHNPGM